MTTPAGRKKTKIKSTGIAYSYIRFSRPEQLKGDSLRRQKKASADYAAENGLNIQNLRLEDLGISAFEGKNSTQGALSIFLEGVRDGKVAEGATLLVESLDRLSRDQITEALSQFLSIVNAGITVVTLMDKMVYSRATINENPGSLLLSIVIMMRAHEESASKGKRVGAAWNKKRSDAASAKKPLTKMCPEWLELKPQGYRLIKTRVKIVKRIFKLSAEEKTGKRSIAKIFNQEGIPTWATWKNEKTDPETGEIIKLERPEDSRIGKTRANGWHDSYIQKILHSEAVLGIFQPMKRDKETRKRVAEGDPIPGYFPIVIRPLEWAAAHVKMGERSRGPRGPRSVTVANLFSGLAYDGYNGAVMRYVDKSRKKDGKVRDWRYLQSDILRTHPGTKSQYWPYGQFETSMLAHLRQLDWSKLAEKKPDDESVSLLTEKAELAAKIKTLRNSYATFMKEFMATDTSAASKKASKPFGDQIAQDIESAEEQLKAVRTALENLTFEQSAMTEGLDDFRALLDAGDPASRRRLQGEIRFRVKSLTLFRTGHPMFAHMAPPPPDPSIPKSRKIKYSLTADKWPVVEIVYANGHQQIITFNRIGPAEHHATRQLRHPVTGAFIVNVEPEPIGTDSRVTASPT